MRGPDEWSWFGSFPYFQRTIAACGSIQGLRHLSQNGTL
jgi:hypothetical protein